MQDAKIIPNPGVFAFLLIFLWINFSLVSTKFQNDTYHNGDWSNLQFFLAESVGLSPYLPGNDVVLRLCIINPKRNMNIKVMFGDGKISSGPSLDSPEEFSNFPSRYHQSAGPPAQNTTESDDAFCTINPSSSGSYSNIPLHNYSRCSNITHAYESPGLYKVTATIGGINSLGRSLWSSIFVKVSSLPFFMGNMVFLSHSTQLFPDELVKFLAAVEDIPFPVEAEVNFGNGRSKRYPIHRYGEVDMPEWVKNTSGFRGYDSVSFEHSYSIPGSYTVVLTILKVEASRKTLNLATAAIKLVILSFLQIIGDHFLLYDSSALAYPRQEVEFVVMVERQVKDLKIDLHFGDATPPVAVTHFNETPLPFWAQFIGTGYFLRSYVRHRFGLAGTFQVKMTISRKYRSDSIVFFCPIVVYDFLHDIRDVRLLLVNNNGESKVTKDQPATFVILIESRPEATVEVLVQSKDQEIKIDYTEAVLAPLPDGILKYLPDANIAGFTTFTYSETGYVEVIAFVTNVELKQFPESIFKARAKVQVVDHVTTNVLITGAVLEIEKAENFVLGAHLPSNIKSNEDSLLTEWKLVLEDSTAEGSWLSYPKPSGKELRLPPFSLFPGQYIFQVEVSEVNDEQLTTFLITNQTKVSVVPMKFRVLVQPDKRDFDISIFDVQVFEATVFLESNDWDDVNPSPIFEWYCTREMLTEDQLTDTEKSSSGCFKDRVKMNGASPWLEMKSTMFSFTQLPTVCYIYARVTRSNRTVTSSPAEVRLVEESRLNISIICLLNCEPLLSPKEILILTYTCNSSELSSTFSLRWTLHSLETANKHSPDRRPREIDLTNVSMTGVESEWLIIKGIDFYLEYKPGNRSYEVKLSVSDTIPGSRASYLLHIDPGLEILALTGDSSYSHANSDLIFYIDDSKLFVGIMLIPSFLFSLPF